MAKKRCSTCRQAKPLSEFPLDRQKPDGYGYICHVCKKEKNASAAGRTSDKFHKAKARARRGGARKMRLNDRQWKKICTETTHCPHCGGEFSDELPPTIDHIVPLNRGGQHVRDNVQALCMSCNSRKKDSLEEELLR